MLTITENRIIYLSLLFKGFSNAEQQEESLYHGFNGQQRDQSTLCLLHCVPTLCLLQLTPLLRRSFPEKIRVAGVAEVYEIL